MFSFLPPLQTFYAFVLLLSVFVLSNGPVLGQVRQPSAFVKLSFLSVTSANHRAVLIIVCKLDGHMTHRASFPDLSVDVSSLMTFYRKLFDS